MKTELLHPIDKGGRIRTYNLLRRIRQHHRITYITLDDGTASVADRDLAAEYCDDLICVPFVRPSKRSPTILPTIVRSAFGPLPFAIGAYRSDEMRDRVAALLCSRTVDVVVSDFLVSSINLPRSVCTATVLFQHNVEAQLWDRRASHAFPLVRPYVRSEARKIAAYEHAACRRFDRVLVVSEEDKRLHAHRYDVNNAVVLPTGVDSERFSPLDVSADPHRIVFVGSMDWQPNDDGAAFFIERILPIVRRDVPSAQLSIVGRNPSRRIRALAAAAGRIDVTGAVEDVRPYIASATVAVVPLRIGGGTRLKIFEAMAMARPVVSTSIGAEGLNVRAGDGLLIADEEVSFANAVSGVLTSPALAASLGAAARDAACQQSWTESARRFNEVIDALVPEASRAAAA